MLKIAMIGAGSVVFANNRLGDLLTYPELKDNLEFSLMNLDPEPLKVSEGYGRRRLEKEGPDSNITATMDLGKALTGAGGEPLFKYGQVIASVSCFSPYLDLENIVVPL